MPENKHEKRGIVQSFNVSPKGMYEGLLIENNGELIQINFPPEWGTTIADLAVPGDHIHVEVEAREGNGHGRHSVYRLLSMGKGGKGSFSLKKPVQPGNGHFSGTVARLNYALHGEINGGDSRYR